MYSENQRHCSARRANDEFLRRMLGGEMSYGNANQAARRDDSPTHEKNGCGCNRRSFCARSEGTVGSSCPLTGRHSSPPCNEGDTANTGKHPACIHAPSLAMVYSPMQSFQGIYEPAVALRQGTLFAELDLPFEGCGRKEACARKCDH